MAKKIFRPNKHAANQSNVTVPRKIQQPKIPDLPTLTELAQLSATLVTMQANMTMTKAAGMAYDLWTACKAKLEAEIMRKNGIDPTPQDPPPPPAIPFDKFLTDHCLAERTIKNRRYKFRKYVEDTFDPKKWEENWDKELPFVPKTTPTAAEFADAVIADLEKRGVPKRDFDRHAEPFKDWQIGVRAKAFTARGKSGATKRHALPPQAPNPIPKPKYPTPSVP